MMRRAGGGRDRFRSEYLPRFDDKGGHSGRSNAPPSRHLWVGNLSHHVTQNQLSEVFLRFGDLENIAFIPGRSYAFVNYKKEEDAVMAMRGLQGFIVAGMPLRLEFQKGDKQSTLPHDEEYPQNIDERHSTERGQSFAHRGLRMLHDSPEKPYSDKPKGNKSTEPSEVLWIGFPAFMNVDEMILSRAFAPFGEIEKITAFPGRSYAFVRFRSVVAACRAKEALQGKLFNNPRVSICFAKSDVGPAEHGRNPTNPSIPPNFQSNANLGLSGRALEPVRRDRAFENSNGEFHMESPRFGSNLEKMPGDANIMGFGRKNSVWTDAGPGPNASGASEHLRLQGLGSEQRMSEEHHRSSPALERGLLRHDFPVDRPQRGPFFEDSWDMDGGAFPLAKKMRVDSFRDKELPEYPFSDLEKEKQHTSMPTLFPDLPEHQIYNKSFESVPFGYKGLSDHSKNLNHLHVENDDLWRTSDSFDAGSGPQDTKSIKWRRFTPESHQPLPNQEWKWEGTIAKGGTPVCRARCFPVGKVLDVMLPEFLDCTARTGLDMLAKHFYQASSSWVVFFVPETDADIAYYNEFMHYLGEKQRAAVAKLGEKITLFLVPPSDFSEQVLKVPGKVSISGVILRFQHPNSNFSALHHPLEAMDSKFPSLMHRATDRVDFRDDISHPKPTSSDFRTSSQGQNYVNSASEHFTPNTALPSMHKPAGSLPYSGPALAMEKLPDPHGERRYDQLQQQNPALPPNWSPHHTHVPNSTIGNFPSSVSNVGSHSFANSVGQEYPLAKPATQSMASSHYTPENSGIVPFAASNLTPPPETKPQVSSSTPIPALQHEQLARLAALLGQQKQSGKDPVLAPVENQKHPSLLQKPVTHTPASSDSIAPQFSQVQLFQQHPSNVSAVSQTGNTEPQGNQQVQSGAREETEADPQKRLQATLQLAATLLQQIQQQSKGDQS